MVKYHIEYYFLISFIINKNKMCPRMVPWGTPVMTFSLSEITLLYVNC